MSTGSPRVSVLVPLRAPAPYLAEALDSIRAQTESSWELVVVLDGPADENVDRVLTGFGDARLRVLSLPEPVGLAAALNAGLRDCRAPYVARMDADDIALPPRLRLQAEFLDRSPDVGLVGGSAQVVDSEGRPTGWRRPRVDQDAVARTLLWRNAFVHPTVMFRRDLVLEVGGYDARVRRIEDWELWLRLLGRTGLANVADPLVKYRIHQGQHSQLRRFEPLELSVLDRSRADAAARLGRSRVGAAARHRCWVLYQRGVFLRDRVRDHRRAA